MILEKEAKFVEHFELIIERGVRQGVFRSNYPKITGNIVALLLSFPVLRGWNFREFSDEQVIDETTEFVLSSVTVERE